MSKKANVLPGFRLSLGYTLAYLSLLVLIPVGGMILKSASVSLGQFWHIATDARALRRLSGFLFRHRRIRMGLTLGPPLAWMALIYLSALGFLLTAVSIQLLPLFQRWTGWRGALILLAPGPALGAAAMLRLRARPEAARLAHGRR